MGFKDNVTQYGFGQLGSGYLSDGDEFIPPSGLAVIAITVILDCQFEELVADTVGYTKADGSEGVAYFGGGGQVAINGTNSDPVPTAELFPAGITLYGRWTKVELGQGAVILYFG